MIFGMPYKGSKNAIAQHIIDMLPPADHFYDLFGGGGAVSHCAALSGKFKYIHYNEINPLVFECFVNSTKGYYQNLCLGSVKKSVIYDPLNKAQKKQEKLYTNEHHEDRFILC